MTRIIRLYTDADLSATQTIDLTKAQAHYLRNVLRRNIGDLLHFFNGRDGQWVGSLTALSKNNGQVNIESQIKPFEELTDLWVLCAPIKKDRFDFCLEKSVELGASDFIPVYTDFTDIKRAKIERLTTNAIEAAQQCGATALLTVHEASPLETCLNEWPSDRVLYVCAERGKAPAFVDALKEQSIDKAGILIGPEGGFSDHEMTLLKNHPQVCFIHLGNLTLRTETALAAAITLYQAHRGSWINYKRD